MNVLFVCTGNTCRSPMAKALFEKMLEDRSISGIKVKSAGIATVEDAPATENAVEVLKKMNIDIEDHKSQLFTDELGEWADVIYVMTDGHRATMHDLYPDIIDKVKLITEEEDGIEDPYGMPIESYERCADEIREALLPILDEVKLKNDKENNN